MRKMQSIFRGKETIRLQASKLSILQ